MLLFVACKQDEEACRLLDVSYYSCGSFRGNHSRFFAPRFAGAPACCLRTALPFPTRLASHSVPQVSEAFTAAFGAAFGGNPSLLCETDSLGRVMLQEVSLCLSRRDLTPCDCWSG